MKEIEVGDYVRTKNGIIDKVDSVCGMIENTVHLRGQSLWFNVDYIVKHSKQLIDLIEVGDIVNGKYVKEIKDYESGKSILALIGIIEEQDIRTILTKEQYMANCYKVGGKDE